MEDIERADTDRADTDRADADRSDRVTQALQILDEMKSDCDDMTNQVVGLIGTMCKNSALKLEEMQREHDEIVAKIQSLESQLEGAKAEIRTTNQALETSQQAKTQASRAEEALIEKIMLLKASESSSAQRIGNEILSFLIRVEAIIKNNTELVDVIDKDEFRKFSFSSVRSGGEVVLDKGKKAQDALLVSHENILSTICLMLHFIWKKGPWKRIDRQTRMGIQQALQDVLASLKDERYVDQADHIKTIQTFLTEHRVANLDGEGVELVADVVGRTPRPKNPDDETSSSYDSATSGSGSRPSSARSKASSRPPSAQGGLDSRKSSAASLLGSDEDPINKFMKKKPSVSGSNKEESEDEDTKAGMEFAAQLKREDEERWDRPHSNAGVTAETQPTREDDSETGLVNVNDMTIESAEDDESGSFANTSPAKTLTKSERRKLLREKTAERKIAEEEAIQKAAQQSPTGENEFQAVRRGLKRTDGSKLKPLPKNQSPRDEVVIPGQRS